MNTGYTEVIDADLSKYFDTIPHANLMATVAERICDGEILRLIQMWLKAPIMEMDKDGTKRNIVVKDIGKPDAGKLHVRFDERGPGETCSLLYP